MKLLMEQVGCTKYPERWSEIFDAAMREYEEQGCELTTPQFYDDLNVKYGCFAKYGAVYKSAAVQTAADEPLARFLTLLAMALRDDEHRKTDIKQLGRLTVPKGKEPLAYEMVTGLAQASQLERAVENMKRRNFPEEVIRDVLSRAVNEVSTYERQHNGAHGFNLLGWNQRFIDANLLLIERLEMEFYSGFSGRAIVFKNKNGEIAVLAHDILLHRDGFALGSAYFKDEDGAWSAYVEEKKDAWIGYPFKEDGYVHNEKIELSKSEWEKVLQRGDPVIRLHIPPSGRMTPEMIDKTLEETKKFAAKHYPEYDYKAFACDSWLMDPQLDTLLKQESNIVKFRQRFHSLNHKSAGRGVFDFIFNKPDMNFDMHDLPEETSLHRALKRHYLSGKAIYEMEGFFF